MTPAEMLSFIHSPRWRGARADMARMRSLLSLLGNPQERLRFVHVAGTNGKGSVCAYIESILREAGYKTGLYTSPYIHRFNERMKLCGKSAEDEALCDIAAKIAPLIDRLDSVPTEFEIVTAVGFEFFARCGCEIVVLETGLGGRLDPTNVIAAPLCSVICAIGLDHVQILGETISEIAAEKAGIIKGGSPVAAYQSEAAAMAVIAEVCAARGAALRVANPSKIRILEQSLSGQSFLYGDRAIKISLLGEHQVKNAALALEATELLREGGFEISDGAVLRGFARACHIARLELLGEAPYFIVDGGHNAQCAAALREALPKLFPGRRRVLLLGMMRDKDVAEFMKILLPVFDEIVCTAPRNPRARLARELFEIAEGLGARAALEDSAAPAAALAKSLAGERGMVCAAGSLYLAGEVREALGFFE